MHSALAALMMRGCRPHNNRPGHHMTVVQSLPLTADLNPKRGNPVLQIRFERICVPALYISLSPME